MIITKGVFGNKKFKNPSYWPASSFAEGATEAQGHNQGDPAGRRLVSKPQNFMKASGRREAYRELCLENPLESCISGLGYPVYMKRPRNVDKTATSKHMTEATKAMNSEKCQESCGQLLWPGTRPHARLSLQSHFNTYHIRWMILPSIEVRTCMKYSQVYVV